METINNIELTDESIFPDDQVLKTLLARSYNAYGELLKLYDLYKLKYTWRYYKDGKAWLCKVQSKSRTIVWMSAWRGYMQATIYFPEKHLDNLYRLGLSTKTMDRIRATKNVGKSKPCIFEVRNKTVLRDFEKVMLFKIAAK